MLCEPKYVTWFNKRCLPGADPKSDPIFDNRGRVEDAICQYFNSPPASLIIEDFTTGSERYVLMSSASWVSSSSIRVMYFDAFYKVYQFDINDE